MKGQEMRPVNIHGFELSGTGLAIHGKPSFAEYEAAGEFIRRAHQASGWWLAEWIKYGESRPDWATKIDQAIDAGDLNAGTVKQYRYIEQNVPKSNRLTEVSFSHHAVVAPLPAKDQRKWLEKARDEGWSRHELQQHVKAQQRTKVIEGQAVLEGMYRIILADPPWSYTRSSGADSGAYATAKDHYPTMTIEELCKLPVAAHAMEESILFCWVTVPLLLQNPGPRDVLEAWGFTYKTNRVWDKVIGMPGHYGMQVKHEHLIIATRGKSCLPTVPTPHDDSVLVERRSDTHSEKPETIRAFIQRHWTKGPYLELFARKRTEGWSAFGNDARLWAKEARTA